MDKDQSPTRINTYTESKCAYAHACVCVRTCFRARIHTKRESTCTTERLHQHIRHVAGDSKSQQTVMILTEPYGIPKEYLKSPFHETRPTLMQTSNVHMQHTPRKPHSRRPWGNTIELQWETPTPMLRPAHEPTYSADDRAARRKDGPRVKQPTKPARD